LYYLPLQQFTIPNLLSYDPTTHPSQASLSEGRDQQGNSVTVLHLPRTKTTPLDCRGKSVFWAEQEGFSNLVAAMQAYLAINPGPNNAHIFAYLHNGTLRPLTKPTFFCRVAEAAQLAGLERKHRHGLQIGGTLEYLLWGVPFNAMKEMGRWTSDSFTLYLHKHAHIVTTLVAYIYTP
jgi:hypothetical protein